MKQGLMSAATMVAAPTSSSSSPPPLSTAASERARNDRRDDVEPCKKILTSQFHWNLNETAYQSLSQEERANLYRLFLFYDSSASGDLLPSINCTRFVQFLQQATIINQEFTAQQAEKIFAEAVLGKLCAYLDADGKPALTFQLFCGALLNCAMAKSVSFEEIVLLCHSLLDKDHVAAVGVEPSSVFNNTWAPTESQVDSHLGQVDFRKTPVFRQVVNEYFPSALAPHESKFHLPEELSKAFNASLVETIRLRFELFDTFEQGIIIKSELFAFCSGFFRLVEPLMGVDIYEFVTRLRELKPGSRYVMFVEVFELMQHLQHERNHPNGNAFDRVGLKTTVAKSKEPDNDEADDANKTSRRKTKAKGGKDGKKGRKQAQARRKKKKNVVVNQLNGHRNSLVLPSSNSARNNEGEATPSEYSVDDEQDSDSDSDSGTVTTGSEAVTARSALSDNGASTPSDSNQPATGEQQRPGNLNNAMASGLSREQKVVENALRKGFVTMEASAALCAMFETSAIQSVHSFKPPKEAPVATDEPRETVAAKPIRVMMVLGGKRDGALYYEIFVRRQCIVEFHGQYHPKGNQVTQEIQSPMSRSFESAMQTLKRKVVWQRKMGYRIIEGLEFVSVDGQSSHHRKRSPRMGEQPSVFPESELDPSSCQHNRRLRSIMTMAASHTATCIQERRSLDRAGTVVRPLSPADIISRIRRSSSTCIPARRRQRDASKVPPIVTKSSSMVVISTSPTASLSPVASASSVLDSFAAPSSLSSRCGCSSPLVEAFCHFDDDRKRGDLSWIESVNEATRAATSPVRSNSSSVMKRGRLLASNLPVLRR